MPDIVKDKFGGVYGWCAHTLIVKVRIWCERKCRQRTQPVHWVFEAGTVGQIQVNKMLNELWSNPVQREAWRLGPIDGWSFKGKDTVPLQAADVIAYELFRLIKDQIVEGGKRDIRLSIRDLLDPQAGPYLDYWDKDRLAKWVEAHKSQFHKLEEA